MMERKLIICFKDAGIKKMIDFRDVPEADFYIISDVINTPECAREADATARAVTELLG